MNTDEPGCFVTAEEGFFGTTLTTARIIHISKPSAKHPGPSVFIQWFQFLVPFAATSSVQRGRKAGRHR
jgi:hypothetical protein